MRMIMWGMLAGSLVLLIAVLFRNREAIQWLTKWGLAAVAAAILLYAANWFGASYDFHIPINGGTVALVGLLGVPGLALLAAVRWTILG
ncbi:pro-sigmaK processing inhibitor BofA family protein [Gorillibacterium timonense]|uniref:pro-sigmaK processing inhibitor BofA family protein n=1 Tax=Gorillibacterium timonense TaxID=1689269 RepID=UPI00071DAAC3|nr:pro-sigmaK processing inhibitor BofA family protein [Gorillibacterium timonense]